jgi:glycosyltransferase involved in cell wall biosynthesis
MKILHLANTYGEEKGGGVHEVVSNVSKYQKIMNHDPQVWFPGNDSDITPYKEDKNIKNLPTLGKPEYGIVKGLYQKISDEVYSFDIIHQHGIWMPISVFNKKIRKISGLNAVIQPHGYLEPYRLNLSKYKKKVVFQLFEKSNLESASAIIACGENEAIKLKKMFPNKDVAIIHNGIPDDFIAHPNMRNRNTNGKKRLLFLSQIIPVKGLERLFHVVSDMDKNKIKNIEILIAGYGEEKYINILKNLVVELHLHSIVKFVGRKHGQEKYDIIDNSDIFILPTFSENYGIVVAEALSRGLPVITTKGTPWEELDIRNCGFCVENSENGIRDGLERILDLSQKELQVMGQNGKQLIKEKYLWSKTTVPTIELYEWVINGGQKPGFII